MISPVAGDIRAMLTPAHGGARGASKGCRRRPHQRTTVLGEGHHADSVTKLLRT